MSPDRLKNSSESELKLSGRVLYLTKDPNLIRRQLDGEDLGSFPLSELAQGISTDEIIPARHCLSFDNDYLADHCLTGFRTGVIKQSDVKNGRFALIVGGSSFGEGSAREHAPLSIKAAGIQYVAGFPIESIFRKNSQNINLLCIDSEKDVEALLNSRPLTIEDLITDSDEISAQIIRNGGLLKFLDRKARGEAYVSPIETRARPMNAIEKIISMHIKTVNSQTITAVQPGDVGFPFVDLRYGYEIMTPISEKVAVEAFGPDFPIANSKSIVFFEDHTVLLGQRRGQDPKEWDQQARFVGKLLAAQRRLAKERFIELPPANVGICHNVIAKERALPGQIIVGTDSHTPSQGALGAFAFGIGATEMAGAWVSNEVRVKIPQVWRFNFSGKLNEGTYGKDVMLYIISRFGIPEGEAVDKAFIYQGEGLESMDFDDHFVLANMVAEAGAIAGFVEPNEVTVQYLMSKRNLARDQIEKHFVRSDEYAIFEKSFDIDLSTIPEMVALPGNPRNGVPVSELNGLEIDVVYVGSCTGGNMKDIQAFLKGLDGRSVKIPTYLQLNALSEKIEAEKKGYIKLLEEAGVIILGPGCGDCCNLGFGIAEKGQKVASNTNRNYENRMGPPEVFILNSERAGRIAAEGKIVV